MSETLLHSWTSSIQHEGTFRSQGTLVFLGRPSLQLLEGQGFWSCLLLSACLHVIPYSEGLLELYNRNRNNFLQDKVDKAEITYLSFQRKEDFGARTKVNTVVPPYPWGTRSKTPS